jgi:hypothetical protein
MFIARSRSKKSRRRMRFLWEGASHGPDRYRADRSGYLKACRLPCCPKAAPSASSRRELGRLEP